MQFIGKLTEADLADVRKLRRTKLYWAWVVLDGKYPIVFGMLILYAIYSGFEGWSTPDWPLTAIFFVVVIGVAGLASFRKRQNTRETLKNVNEKRSERIDLVAEGVKLDGINGQSRTVPWKSFRGWREGDRIVLLYGRKARQGIVLPIATFSDGQRQELRQLLKSHIPMAIE